MSERPKEGVYLDAALGVIGEQVAERIDELSRRRRRTTRTGVVALAAVTVFSGSMAAAAMTGAFGSSESGGMEQAMALAAPVQLRCVDGTDASDPAFFTVHYRTAEDAGVDAVAVCAQARTAIAEDAEARSDASPEQLVAMAERIFGTAGVVDARVDHASFGPVAASAPSAARTCVTAARTVVLHMPADAADAADVQCAGEAR